MNIEKTPLKSQHILHHFDDEILQLHQLTLQMLRQVIQQWNLAQESMRSGNLEPALEVIAQCSLVYQYEDKVNQAVLNFLARESPVAMDLRMALSISKISVELIYLCDEVREVAKLILALYEPRNGMANIQLLNTIKDGIRDIVIMLNNLAKALDQMEISQIKPLLQSDTLYEPLTHDGIKHQLTFITNFQRQIKTTLIALQMMKSLESSMDYCKDLAKFCLLMIDGNPPQHTTH